MKPFERRVNVAGRGRYAADMHRRFATDDRSTNVAWLAPASLGLACNVVTIAPERQAAKLDAG